MAGLEIRVMGPFELYCDAMMITAGGPRRRALLAALALSANCAVSSARLQEMVWGEHPPTSASNLIHGYVSDWRSLLSPTRRPRASGSRLESTPGGYLLRLGEDECDLLRFRRDAAAARMAAKTGEIAEARGRFARAISERRGPPCGEFVDGGFGPSTQSIESEWLSILRDAADLELRYGGYRQAYQILEAAIAERPTREDLTELAMRALCRCGRLADALVVYERTRVSLADALGVDPTPALQHLYLQVLRQDPELSLTSAAAAAPLPTPLTRLIGREADTSQVVHLLREHRLVTLTGPGGSGKTRLAIAAAQHCADTRERRIIYLDATPIDDTSLLWPAVAAASGQTLTGARPALEALLLQQSNDHLLLVLDNVDDLAGVANEVAHALSLNPSLSILATSRIALSIAGEQQLIVRPLPTPAPEDTELSTVLASTAVQLFLERARDVQPEYDIAEADAQVLAGICRRVDGLPLALELAAPWTRTLSLHGLLERLDRPLSVLTSAPNSARPSRHQAMRTVVRASYAARSDNERRLLKHLSLFISGAQIDALEATAGLGTELAPCLAELIAANLVQRMNEVEAPRYRLLETVRDYAREQYADQSTKGANPRAIHAEWFAALTERASRSAATPGVDDLVARVGRERDEIRAALSYFESSDEAPRLLTMAVDCLALWWDHGYIREGYDRLTSALQTAHFDNHDGILAAAHAAAAFLAEACNETDAARRHVTELLAQAERSGNAALITLGRGLHGNDLGWDDWSGDAALGIAALEAARKTARALPRDPQRWGWANQAPVSALISHALIDLLRYRDPARARAIARSVADDAVDSDSHYRAFALRSVGFLNSDAGRWDIAQAALDDSLEFAQRSRSLRNQARTHEELARLNWARGEPVEAIQHASRAVYASRDAGHAINWGRCACLLADLHTWAGRVDEAAEAIDQAHQALAPCNDTSSARQTAPRRARLARLNGDIETAAHHLASCTELETAVPLSPEKTVYIVEAVASAPHDPQRREHLIAQLTTQAARLGLAIPAPEQSYLREVSSQHPRPSPRTPPVAPGT